MYDELLRKEAKLAVIGLGYVGLPIALEFAKQLSVIGFDINAGRVEMMRNHQDPSGELEASAFEGTDITFTDSLDVLREAKFFIVAVPTPIDEHAQPDLRPLLTTLASLGMVTSVLAMSTLGFVKVGLQPPRAELGLMITESFPFYDIAPWMALAPIAVLFLLTVCFLALRTEDPT